MAHKKGQGSTKNGRDSNPQYLGVKHYGGETVRAGGVIVRQRGTPLMAGFNVRRGKDDTLFSVADGRIVFQGRKVHVDPLDPARRVRSTSRSWSRTTNPDVICWATAPAMPQLPGIARRGPRPRIHRPCTGPPPWAVFSFRSRTLRPRPAQYGAAPDHGRITVSPICPSESR